jgi:hypothetical protein
MEARIMTRILTTWLFCLVLLIVCGCAPRQSDPEAEKAGASAARKWIKLVDARLYQQSWQEAAALFRERVSQDQWRQTLQTVREPLGAVQRREVISTQYKTSVKEGPEGQYVIVEFSVAFSNGKETVETVTPMKEADGQWRVVGYSMEK